MLVMIVVFIFR